MSGHEFDGKVALVTGGGSGIGRAASRLLARRGAAVAVVDLNDDGAAATKALIEADGGRAIAIHADIALEADNAAMFDAAERAFGGVDYAFLNAGVLQPYAAFEAVTLGLFDRMIGINLRGTFMGMQQARARLRRGGACVVTASAAAVVGFSEASAYAAAKHGVLGLARSAARAFSDRGLRVNAVCPGYVLTPMTGIAQDDALPDDIEDPVYRGALPARLIAEAALFLLSRRAAGINGHAQLVDAAELSTYPPIAM